MKKVLCLSILLMIFVVNVYSLTEKEEFELYKKYKFLKEDTTSVQDVGPEVLPEEDNNGIIININSLEDLNQDAMSENIEEAGVFEDIYAKERYKINQLSFKFNAGYMLDNTGEGNYDASLPVSLLAEFAVFDQISIGAGVSYFQRKNQSTSSYFDVKTIVLNATFYPWYISNSFNFYCGAKLNYFMINYENKEALINNVIIDSYFDLEPFIGFLIPLGENFFFDINFAYQFKQYIGSVESNNQISDVDIADDTLVMSAGLKF